MATRRIDNMTEAIAQQTAGDVVKRLKQVKPYPIPNKYLLEALGLMSAGEFLKALQPLGKHVVLVHYAPVMTFNASRLPTMAIEELYTVGLNGSDKRLIKVVAKLSDGETLNLKV